MPKASSKSVSKAVSKKKVAAKLKVVKATAAPKIKPKVAKKKPLAAKPAAVKRKTKPTVKRKTTPKAKVTPKTVAKTLPKKSKIQTKATPKPRQTTSAAANKSTTRTPKVAKAISTPAVVLPTRMSIRAREKALVLADTFTTDFYTTGLTLARAGGFCFLLLGGLVTMSHLQTPSSDGGCSDSSCLSASASLAIEAVSGQQSSDVEVKLLSTIPANITNAVTVPLQVHGAHRLESYLSYVTEYGATNEPLTTQTLGNNKYEISVEPNQLLSVQQELKLHVYTKGSDTPLMYSLGTFVSAAGGDQVGGNTQLDTSTVATTSAGMPLAGSFTISAPAQINGLARVQLADKPSDSAARLYVRKTTGLHVQYLGTILAGATDYTFDSRRIPNGEYQLYAQIKHDSKVSRSNQVALTISNQVDRAARTISMQDREFAQTASVFAVATATELTLSQSTTTPAQVEWEISEDVTAADLVRARLNADADQLGSLLTRYAVAQQSGDSALLAQMSSLFDQYTQSVMVSILSDTTTQSLAQDFDQELQLHIESLQGSVVAFEALRRERTESDSAQDSDQDGISDFDEVTLYGTNPLLADTDSDGFTDGIEVTTGFNPTDAAVEAVITYQSPRDVSAGITTDALLITTVTPEVVLGTTDSPQVVRTLIQGQGLPNSFVTLFVYSDPTIITVSTDDTGFFTYTIDQELADGQHQVFAVLTDNTGAIIAKSEPYRFAKAGSAFTSAAAVGSSISYTSDSSQDTIYPLVLGMSVFALGILLVFLAIGLRSNRPQVVTTPAK